MPDNSEGGGLDHAVSQTLLVGWIPIPHGIPTCWAAIIPIAMFEHTSWFRHPNQHLDIQTFRQTLSVKFLSPRCSLSLFQPLLTFGQGIEPNIIWNIRIKLKPQEAKTPWMFSINLLVRQCARQSVQLSTAWARERLFLLWRSWRAGTCRQQRRLRPIPPKPCHKLQTLSSSTHRQHVDCNVVHSAAHHALLPQSSKKSYKNKNAGNKKP